MDGEIYDDENNVLCTMLKTSENYLKAVSEAMNIAYNAGYDNGFKNATIEYNKELRKTLGL
jgi:hypothetical protein